MIDIKDWKKMGQSRIYGLDETLNALGYAWNTQTNIVLFGDPGYGKTMTAELFGNYLLDKGEITSPIYLKSLHQATTEEELLGGLNVKKYKDEGELIYLLEKSFIEHEYVVLDEMLNAYLGVIGVLNDILVSKKVRQGSSNNWVPIKTKLVVACTNKTREEVAIDPTTRAIMERFPMEVLSQWTSHTYTDYLEMLQSTPEGKNNSYYTQFAAKMAEITNLKDNTKISPRTVYTGMRAITAVQDTKALKYFPLMGSHLATVTSAMKALSKKSILEDCQSVFQEAHDAVFDLFQKKASLKEILPTASTAITIGLSLHCAIKKNESQWTDANFDFKNDLLDQLASKTTQIIFEVKEMIVDPEMGSVEAQFDNYQNSMQNAWLRDLREADFNINNTMLVPAPQSVIDLRKRIIEK